VADAIVDTLRGIVGPANLLTGVELSAYVVDGRTPAAAAFPGSVEEVSAVLALANEASVAVMPWGGGTAISVGAPPARSGIVLGLRRLRRLIEHEPGDLTATVEAGATVEELQTALATRGQWFSLDPPAAEAATVGGVLSANASGPRRHLYGTARDLLIGVTVVCADGAIVRGGGKVVKNVAGYDLPKLFVGAFGSLGVIVEATVKLRPRPDAEALVAARFPSLKDSGLAARAVMASDLIPSALEVLDGAAAAGIGLDGDRPALVVGLDGLSEQVQWQRAELARLCEEAGTGEVRDLPLQTWGALPLAAQRAFAEPAAVMGLSVLPARVAEVVEVAGAAARAAGLRAAFAAHAGVGAVVGALAGGRDPASVVAAVVRDWRQAAHAGGGHARLEAAPLAVKELVPVWDQPGAALRIMARIKQQVDPRGILNPGRFVGGI
jgi:glycolate dehydrogenase FAD-binding subunit